MGDDLLTHVGRRVRLYRKMKNLNVEELAAIIHKSKATISKYEAGKISIDINTLFDIANALNITIYQLLDCQLKKESAPSFIINPFANTNLLYFYFYDGRKKRILKSIIKLNDNDFLGKIEATLYMNINSPKDCDKCECLYFGYMKPFDIITSFVLENQSTSLEQITICMINPMKKFESATGLMSGISDYPLAPASVKVLISKKPLLSDTKLNEYLIITRDELKKIKSINMYTVDSVFF